MSKQPAGDTDNVDSVYYRDGLRLPLAKRLLIQARHEIFDLFMRECAPPASATILDIGVSDEENDEANILEKLYPHKEMITCAGIGTGQAVQRAYPGVKFVQIVPGEPLPFADKQFDFACSNAVLEHVGGPAQRRAFLQEAQRVSRTVFMTVPNRWFPVEHHTGLPLMHFAPALFRKVLHGSRYDYWTDPRNMDFLSASQLASEWPGSRPPKLFHTGLKLGLFSSNVALVARDDG
jgi:SAM-dependent methyltransferase